MNPTAGSRGETPRHNEAKGSVLPVCYL